MSSRKIAGSTSSKAGRFKPSVGRILLALVSVVVVVLLFEGALRVYFYSRGVGREDVQELLRRSSETSEEISAAGVYGVVRPSEHPDS